jgi:hypothetical protein
MNNRLVIVAFAISSIATTSHATLTTPVLLESTPSITAGQSVAFPFSFTDQLTPGYDWEAIKSVDFLFSSGDGQTFTGSFSTPTVGGINPTVTLSTSFTYANAGTYTPSFSADVTTFDGYHQDFSYQYQSGTYYYSYSCGWFSTCHGSYPIYSTGYQTYNFTTTLTSNTSAVTSLTVTPVPEPETYAMIMAGLGLLGVVSRRRKV